MTGRPSLLATDGYKFNMAEAGFSLRRETFYYAHRRGGVQVVPFDAEAEIARMLPTPHAEDYAYLASHEYDVGAGYRAAMAGPHHVEVRALPKGAWFVPREPIFSVTGPSALVSWLEPLVLMMHVRIQVATLALANHEQLAREVAEVTCEEERELIQSTLDAVGVRAPAMRVASDAYAARVGARVRELVAIVEDPARIFEVGMRAASCVAQHRIALAECKDAGVTRTSHVGLAHELGLVPVGTMGHEHVQRFGSDDAAFRAMRDRRPGRSSYLLDTFDTFLSGVPAAFGVISEAPNRRDSIRYDSGEKESQYRFAVAEAAKLGIRPVHILEDGFDADQTRRFEDLRREVGYQPDEQFYGYGGYLVASTAPSRLTRDRVAAVYKLSQSGRSPTMKFGNELAVPPGSNAGSGKESVPGEPVVFRRLPSNASGPVGIIGQHGEAVPAGYALLTGADEAGARPTEATFVLSEATEALVKPLRARRAAMCGEVS